MAARTVPHSRNTSTLQVSAPLGFGSSGAFAPSSIQPVPGVGLTTSPICGTVLYVEDDPLSVRLVEEILHSLFPRVILNSARTGAAGLEMARAQPCDLILLDLVLPDMSGLQVVRDLNVEISAGDLRVVLLTGARTSPEAARALMLGALEVWDKPLNLADFAAGMARYLSLGSAGDP